MTGLHHRHLTTMTFRVDYPAMVNIGPILVGLRCIALIIGGKIVGDRLCDIMLPGGND